MNCGPSQQAMSLKCSGWALTSLIPVCSYKWEDTWHMKVNQDPSSRPKLAAQTNSSGLLPLNKYLINVLLSGFRAAKESSWDQVPMDSPGRHLYHTCTVRVCSREVWWDFPLWRAKEALSRVLPENAQRPMDTWWASPGGSETYSTAAWASCS